MEIIKDRCSFSGGSLGDIPKEIPRLLLWECHRIPTETPKELARNEQLRLGHREKNKNHPNASTSLE